MGRYLGGLNGTEWQPFGCDLYLCIMRPYCPGGREPGLHIVAVADVVVGAVAIPNAVRIATAIGIVNWSSPPMLIINNK